MDELRAGLALHQAGRAEDAEAIYQRVIRRDPGCSDAWHLSGCAAAARGDAQSAQTRIARAIRLNPATPAFHNSLGEVLTARGQLREAKLCYREALRLDGCFVPALVNLGNALQALGEHHKASLLYWKAIEVQPDCAQAFTNLGNALGAQGFRKEAMDCYQSAFRLQPDNPEILINLASGHLRGRQYAEAEEYAHRALQINPGLTEGLSNLSVALLNQGRLAEAEKFARQALDSRPGAAHLHVNLASILLRHPRLAEAEAACRRGLELAPDQAEAANNLGIILQAQDRFDEAAQSIESAIYSRPGFAEAWTNLGTVEQMRDRHARALDCFDEALRLDPDFPKAHFCRGLTLLRSGHLREGFAEYEWRWRAQGLSARAHQHPAWEGSPAPGKTILLFAEQGLGDTIQFARFVPLVGAHGARVIVECQPPLAGLLRSLEGPAQIITTEDPLPPFDAQAALMSLPHILGVDAESTPLQVPYLSALTANVEIMRKALGPAACLRIGLAWAGNPKHVGDRHRSISLETLDPLRDVPGVEWISLQEGDPGGWPRKVLTDTGGVPELAALMSCLDLVVSVDTMPAHLAGALGRPVFLLLSWAPDWRWQLEREDSPWYPTMRLFRQQARGCWEPVIHRVAEAVCLRRTGLLACPRAGGAMGGEDRSIQTTPRESDMQR